MAEATKLKVLFDGRRAYRCVVEVAGKPVASVPLLGASLDIPADTDPNWTLWLSPGVVELEQREPFPLRTNYGYIDQGAEHGD